ncbi:MAG: flagellar protein export ATPase FliI [Methylococcaceae bacterium]
MNYSAGSFNAERQSVWLKRIQQYRPKLQEMPGPLLEGKLSRMVGLTLEALGCKAPVGSRCQIIAANGRSIEAEVVGFAGEKTYLMPIGTTKGLEPDCRVIPIGYSSSAKVGFGLLGRVLDGEGQALDGKGTLKTEATMGLSGEIINPLARQPIRESLDVGIRSINALLSVGRGQRLGLFAGTGVGKSVLLGMMTRFTEADVIVVGLIGERGREVNEFVHKILGEEGLKRAVVVVTPADYPPLMRVHGAMLATSIAEYFRDQGKNVLLLMDSLTRFAQAHREIALAIDEPPATRGYPPSVFAKIPHLVERAGNGEQGNGSITAFYTVLTEGDDPNDPIADAARGILDGHIVLSRSLAEAGHFPAIDIEASVSRVMPDIVEKEHLQYIRKFRQYYSLYQQNRDLISVGAYQAGTDTKLDEAIKKFPALLNFLQQDMDQSIDSQQSTNELLSLLSSPKTTD